MRHDNLRVGSFCREKTPRRWHGRQILRVAKREGRPTANSHRYQRYFVVAHNGAVGYGAWITGADLIALTPLELLAMQADCEDSNV